MGHERPPELLQEPLGGLEGVHALDVAASVGAVGLHSYHAFDVLGVDPRVGSCGGRFDEGLEGVEDGLAVGAHC